jgi:hypothetical protein
MDSQHLSDSREDASVPRETLNNVRSELVGTPAKGPLKTYLISIYFQDTPDPIYGRTSTDITTLRTTLKAYSKLFIIPSYIVTKSNLGSGSSSRDNTSGLRAEYRMDAKTGIRSALTFTTSNRTGSNVLGTTTSAYTSKQSQTALNLDYIASSSMTITNIIQSTDTTTGSVSQLRRSYSTGINYVISPETLLRMLLNLEKNPAPYGNRSTWEFGATRKIDKNLDFDLDYKKQSQNSSGDSDYAGNFLSMKLMAKF